MLRLLGVSLLLLLAGAARAEEPVVASIDFDGLHLHSPEEVRLKMQTHIGRPYSAEELDRDIRRLLGTGWFYDVRLAKEGVVKGADGVRIRLEVLENDILREIRLVGNRKFDDEELLKDAHLKIGEYFAPYETRLDADRIRDKYIAEGYAFVKVEAKATAGERGTVVTLTVREGPRVRVGDIELIGVDNLSKFKMKHDVMQTKERAIWNIFSPPDFKEEQLEDDVRALNNYARAEGYLDAKVYVRELVYDETKENVRIRIQIEEGTLYVVDSIDVQGNTLFTSEQLLADTKLAPGEPCALKTVYRDRQEILGKYWEKAYLDSEIVEERRLQPEKGHLKLTWHVKEGEKVYVGRIDFFGNHRTREKVLRREVRLLPGEEFNKKLLDASMTRLKALQYFEPMGIDMLNRSWYAARDPIVVVEVKPGGAKDVRDVVFNVQEGRTGSVKIGGSFNDTVGFSGLLDVTQRNFDIARLPHSFLDLISGDAFAGAGQIARIVLQPGFRRSRYEASFTEPWVFGFPVSLTLSGTAFDQDQRFYRERRQAFTVGLGRHWDDFEVDPDRYKLSLLSPLQHVPGWFLFDDVFLRGLPLPTFYEHGLFVGLTYRIERINITSLSSSAPSDVFDVAGLSYLSSVTTTVGVDRRDSSMFPSSGFISTVSYEHAGYPLGGYYDFWKLTLRNQSYTTLFRLKNGGKTIFFTDIRGGFAQEHYYTTEVPIFERFYAGGTGSMRGFEYRTISPKENDEPIGGKIELIGTAEVHFPILRIPVFGPDVDLIRGAFFTDWGTVVARTADFGYFRWSYGFGIRLQVPVGPQVIPVALDFGFPYWKQEGDRRQTFHISFDFGF